MKYAIMLGSNFFVDNNGLLKVEIDGKLKEFLKVREIYRERSDGSFLVLDCDIKDSDEIREVKLFKSKPVDQDKNVEIECNKTCTIAKRPDGSVIIKVEQIESDNPTIPKTGPIPEMLKSNPVDAILRITGDFYAFKIKLSIDNEKMVINDNIFITENYAAGTNGITIREDGFSL